MTSTQVKTIGEEGVQLEIKRGVTINPKMKVFFPFRRGGFYRGRGGRGTSERGDGKELDDDHEEGEQVCQC